MPKPSWRRLSRPARHLRRARGRLIPESMKQMAITLIDEAVSAGARQHKACEVLDIISCRTLRCWRTSGTLLDRRKSVARHCTHALSDADREAIVATCNQPEYQRLPLRVLYHWRGLKLRSSRAAGAFGTAAREHLRLGLLSRSNRQAPRIERPPPSGHARSVPLHIRAWPLDPQGTRSRYRGTRSPGCLQRGELQACH